ncbi:MAG: hypothetical protein AAGG50_03750 [Bacteroidota bacterium]
MTFLELSLRVTEPARTLLSNTAALLTGVVVAAGAEYAHLVGFYVKLFATDPVLVVVALSLVILDVPVGLAANLYDREARRLRLRRFDPARAWGWVAKIAAYAVATGACTLVANGIQQLGWPVVSDTVALLDELYLVGVILTEVGSILSHLGGFPLIRRGAALLGRKDVTEVIERIEVVERITPEHTASNEP